MASQQELDKIQQQLTLLGLAKSAAGMEDAVKRALAEPGLFVYGELAGLPSMQQLQGTPQEAIWRTLQLFAYGTFMDYTAQPAQFIELGPDQVRKLKQLTMCTLANAQVMPYDHIMRSLELTTVRALEDFIIQDCIYCRLLKCKLDQKGRRVHVQEVYSRDVQPAKLPELTAGLQQLLSNVCEVMSGLEENVRHISEAHKENMQAEDLFQKQLEEAKKTSAVVGAIDQGEGEFLAESTGSQGFRGSLMGTSRSNRGTRAAPDAKKSRK